MTTKKEQAARQAVRAFSIATRDAKTTDEIGEIAGVEFYARELTAREESEFWQLATETVLKAHEQRTSYQTADEMALFEPYLRKRAVEPSLVAEGWYAENVPATQHIEVLSIFAPNLARAARRASAVLDGDAGKVRSAKQRS